MMGSAMCGHLLTAGHRLVVHSRTRSKTQPLLGHGRSGTHALMLALESMQAVHDSSRIIATTLENSP